MTLSGKTAVVTGSGRGIGRAISLALAAAGAQVAVLDVDGDAARAVAIEVNGLGVKGLALAADLTRRADVERAVGDTLAQFGQLDVLVNNAGWDRMAPFLESEEADWDRIIALNFKAILYTCKAALPAMVARGAGAFSKTLAREMARSGITVNVVCPGLTDTPLLQGIREDSVRNAKVIEAVTRAIPLGRVGRPADVAAAVVYLASAGADYVTGQTLSVSGGLTMC